MKHINYFITAVCTLLIITSTNAQTYKANVGLVSQEQTNWCWCANSKCVLDYYGTVEIQCKLAEYARSRNPSTFGTTNCCTQPSGRCNTGNEIKGQGSIQDVIKKFGNIESTPTTALDVTKIKSELLAKRPFVIGVMWSSSGGHVMVGCAYSGSSLTYMDPWKNNGMTTQNFTGGKSITSLSGNGTWAETLVMTTPYPSSDVDELDALSSAINVYPNPSQGNLTISSELAVKTINVFNTTGQLISTYTANTERSFSLKLPAAGFYTVQVITENGMVNKKVIVQ
jgi:hypothetical protein